MIDFYQVQEDLQTMFRAQAAITALVRSECIFIEMMDRDLLYNNMPLVNIRLADAEVPLITIPNGYYPQPIFSIDIISFDLSEFRKAARVRDNVLKVCLAALQANRAFSNIIQTSRIDPNITFSAGVPEQGGGNIAVATFRVRAEAYADPS